MKKVFALIVSAAMGLSSVAFAADAATAAPANGSHLNQHHAKAKKTVTQKAQAAKKVHKHAKQQKKAAH